MHTPRNELKFYISTASARLLEKRLCAVLPKDAHTAFGSAYEIRSLYFDSPDSAAFLDKVNGVEKREKYRIRFYNGSLDYLRLEKKEKVGSKSLKTGEAITRDQAKSLVFPSPSPMTGGALFSEATYRVRHELFSPILFVDYTRRAFLYPAGNVRITLDSDIFACRYQGSFLERSGRIPVLDSHETVLEVKYDSFFPPFLSALLEDIPRIHCAISKYCKCYEQLF